MNKKEERAKLLAEMKEMSEKASGEKRSFTDDEKKVFAEKVFRHLLPVLNSARSRPVRDRKDGKVR